MTAETLHANEASEVKENVRNIKTQYDVQETKKDIINTGFRNK